MERYERGRQRKRGEERRERGVKKECEREREREKKREREREREREKEISDFQLYPTVPVNFMQFKKRRIYYHGCRRRKCYR